MNIDQLTQAGKKLFGHKHWKLKLAQSLGVNPATIYRMVKRLSAAAGTEVNVPGPYEVAIKGMLQHKRAQDVLDKAARKLLPRKFKYKRKTDGKGNPVVRLIKRRPRKEKGDDYPNIRVLPGDAGGEAPVRGPDAPAAVQSEIARQSDPAECDRPGEVDGMYPLRAAGEVDAATDRRPETVAGADQRDAPDPE